MVDKRPSSSPTARQPGRKISGPIDVANHLAQRRAVGDLLRRQRVMVTARRFRGGEMTARVLIDGELYDVDEFRLSQLQSGLTPADLMLDPVAGEVD